jgi:Rieske Fe-S protein
MPDPIAPFLSSTATTRRTVLRAAGLVALTSGGVAALGACSPEADTAAPTPSPTSAPASSAPATSAPASSSPPAEPSPTPSETTSEAPSGPSVAASEVPVGGGVILEDANYVITQPTKGKFKAFSKICTHQGCPVASVKGGTINCNCHGSKYSIEDGSVVNPPAPKALEEAKVTVSSGRVVVAA